MGKHEHSDKDLNRAKERSRDIVNRLVAQGFSRTQAEFAVMPVERYGFKTIGEVRAYMQRTRPALFS